MYQTIRLSSCVSVHGEIVKRLQNGEVLVRDGGNVYRGKPLAHMVNGCELAANAASARKRESYHRSART